MATTTLTTTPPIKVVDFASEKASTPAPKQFSWEQGPMALIPTPRMQTGKTDQYTAGATEMALVHNCIIRALNSIYIQAPHVPASEYANLAAYSLAAFQGLTMHHDSEEAFLFPQIEKATGTTGLMDDNVQGHRDFHDNFEAWGHWLEDVVARKADFESTKCRIMMDGFMTPLSAHLADEIPTLLGLAKFGDGLDLAGLLNKEGEMVMGGMSKTTQLPLFLLNHDITFEGSIHAFPAVPAPVKFVLRSVMGRWQSSWWQFATCGYDGRPRELKFLGNEIKGKERA